MIGPTYVSVREEARLLDMSERRVRRFLAYGRIKGAQRVDGKWLVPVPVEFVSGGDSTSSVEAEAERILANVDRLLLDTGPGDESGNSEDVARLTLELSPDEFATLSEAAQRAGMSLHNFVVSAAMDLADEGEV